MSTSPLCFDPYVINNLQGCRILDIGCGHGKWGYLAKKYAPPEMAPRYVTGIDVFEPHVAALRREGIYDDVQVADACCLPFDDQSFDSVIACEVLEHLPRDNGTRFMAEVRRVARQMFVVSTPNFNCLRGGGMTLDGFNEHEAHETIYSYRDFRALGFTQVVGTGHLKIRPWRLAVALSSLGLRFPALSRYLLGFWFADGKKISIGLES